jgi:hypothetical protein
MVHASALLVCAFMSLSADAQTTEPGQEPIFRISDNWSVSVPAGSEHGATRHAGTIDKGLPQARPDVLPAISSGAATLKDIESNPSRAWQDHMNVRENAEDYNCLLSFGIGGELKSGGYAGTRLFGKTLTLSGAHSK